MQQNSASGIHSPLLEKSQFPKKLLEQCFDVLHNGPTFTGPNALEFVTLELSMSQNFRAIQQNHPFHNSLFTFLPISSNESPLLISEHQRSAHGYATNPLELKLLGSVCEIPLLQLDTFGNLARVWDNELALKCKLLSCFDYSQVGKENICFSGRKW